MNRLSLLLFFVAAVSATLGTQNLHPLSDEFIQEINSKQSTWKAGRNFAIEDYELVKTLTSGSKGFKNRRRLRHNIHDVSEDVPDAFDAREAWPECADIIGLIRDQSTCGGCWAFGAAEAMSDRICIQSNAEKKLLVSSQAILTCTLLCGCHGGFLDIAWITWYAGIVTGGLYNHTEQGCQAYFLPPCDDHPHQCTDYVNTPSCDMQCDDNELNYDEQKTYGKDVVSFQGEKHIQLEILKNGPVEAAFSVYSDFASYKEGIYQYVSGEFLGGHAIKILGWGVENDVKYWLVANSWNEGWGENGYFRILRGNNECGIEEEAVAGTPDFNRF